MSEKKKQKKKEANSVINSYFKFDPYNTLK